MAMDHHRYAQQFGLEPTAQTLETINRIRDAGAYLRNRAYRNFLATKGSEADKSVWVEAFRASERFETRQTTARLCPNGVDRSGLLRLSAALQALQEA